MDATWTAKHCGHSISYKRAVMAHQIASDGSQEVRVGGGGVAFAVGIDSPADISLESSVVRVQESGEPALTAEQIQRKLDAAEIRRQAALDEVRYRAAEEGLKLEKASETRQHAVEEVKEALEARLENAQANQEAHREALLERLHQEELHHEQVLSRRAYEFHNRVREMDARYNEVEGKHHQVLEEIVNKVKEHNDRVQQIHDEMMAHRQQDQVDAAKQEALRKKWMEASNQRDVYLTIAETRLHTEKLN
ncbi:hypothetical protein BV898_07769 [Hypsibius exemplaris]|uniref:Uncharacterized protein n=1 Tax=Hypsibius exemplaris TaxID=2072580 RepID=A0A1W0WSK1_HYPEX|nr:hypothetical protein BV898_07769 [Hypsibius exemplaris]